MRSLITIFCLIIFSWVYAQKPADLTKKEHKFVEGVFQEGLTTAALEKLDPDLTRVEYMRDGDRIYLLKQKDKLLGYLLVTRTKGRYDYFDYLLAFDSDLAVRGLKIIVYRSSHGAAVCQKKWLSQFEGYAGENLSLGKEVDAVAGATISATSLVKDIKRCYQFMIELKEGGVLQ